MTRRYISGSLIATLAALLLTPLPTAAQDTHFSEAGYDVVFDELTPANQANFPPIVLTAGEDVFASVDPEDIRLRCSVFTGKKGVTAIFNGSVAEGDDLETIGN